MEKFLRKWRQDALNRHQYESAIFIGDKLLALTDNDEDAFWLAQVHFSTGNYTRAQGFLSKDGLVENNPACRYLSAHCYIKQAKFEDAMNVLGDKNPVHLISTPGSARQKLRHIDVNLRTKHPKAGRSDRIDKSEERNKEDYASIQAEAAMCYLRGVCYAKQNSFDRAKECYKDAVRIDVQCFEAFDQLMKNSLMSPDEEWNFLESLNFDSIQVDNNPSVSQEAAQFTKTLYTTRISKYSKPDEFTSATETLSTHYNLSTNADILLSKAELLFTQCRFNDALSLTSSILERDRYNFNCMPVHLACLHELNERNVLFLLAHDLADTHPEEPASWLAIGVYYLNIGRIAEARRFFSKASMMDPHFGPAWIGFAHTFAAEGEHDQAISAYSTAARLFQGTHLPQLFLGMQNLQLHNMALAHEYLNTAHNLCKHDPLLLNEMGVVLYHEEDLVNSIASFRAALKIARNIGSDDRAWLPTRANLGHALRRTGHFQEAIDEFDEVLRRGGKDAGIFCAKGLAMIEMDRSWEAIEALHEALAVAPQDPMATELLNKALEHNESDLGIDDTEEEDDFDQKIGRIKGQITERRGRRNRMRGGGEGLDESSFLGAESMLVDDE